MVGSTRVRRVVVLVMRCKVGKEEMIRVVDVTG